MRRERLDDALHEVVHVERDLDEHVQHWEWRSDVDWYEAAMTVMNHEVAAELFRAQVVNAAGAVRDVAHNDRFGASEALHDIREHACKHEQPLSDASGGDAPRVNRTEAIQTSMAHMPRREYASGGRVTSGSCSATRFARACRSRQTVLWI